jgi:hypothetical protein
MVFRGSSCAPQLIARPAPWCHCAAIRRNLNFWVRAGFAVQELNGSGSLYASES